ncbi:MAG: DUF1127 domain-containing protein [Ectothiorhodospiraceae bacterium]|jgi:uncharacterized protein YjiS (DUF1127 family)
MAVVVRQPVSMPRPPPGFTGRVRATLAAIRVWRRRARSRAELSRFDARGRADIGVRYEDAARECRKPFWRA